MKEYCVVVTHVSDSAICLSNELSELIEKYKGWDLITVTEITHSGTVVVFGRNIDDQR